MKIEANAKFIITGDSVTDCGRARPYGDGNGALGSGYAMMTAAALDAVYPERHIHVVNMGQSGDTTRELKARWQHDVLDLKPDWVSVMIGVNDVWRQYDRPHYPEIHVSLEEYRASLTELVTATLPSLSGMVLMTPFYMGQEKEEIFRKTLAGYGQIVRETAEKYGLVFVDTQAAMDAYFAHYTPYAMSGDKIHPNHVGGMIIARALLKALEFDWNH